MGSAKTDRRLTPAGHGRIAWRRPRPMAGRDLNATGHRAGEPGQTPTCCGPARIESAPQGRGSSKERKRRRTGPGPLLQYSQYIRRTYAPCNFAEAPPRPCGGWPQRPTHLRESTACFAECARDANESTICERRLLHGWLATVSSLPVASCCRRKDRCV